MTATQSYVNMNSCTTVLSADQQQKEETMLDQQKITILYCRLSNEDALDRESNSIANQIYMHLYYYLFSIKGNALTV